MKYDDEYIRSYEKRLIEENTKYWKEDFSNFAENGDEGYIYAFHAVSDNLHHCVAECIAAKGLQEKYHLPILGIQGIISIKGVAELDRSFGIQPLDLLWNQEELIPLYDELVEKALKISESTGGDPQKILQITYEGIECGEAIYDTLIRDTYGTYEGTQDIKPEVRTDVILRTFLIMEAARQMFQRRRPRYVIFTEWGYMRGMFARAAQEFGAEIFLLMLNPPYRTGRVSPSKKYYTDIKVSSYLRAVCEQAPDEATLSKKKDLFLHHKDMRTNSSLVVTNDKPNVFIMLHGLADCARFLGWHSIFTDYVDWLVTTLKLIREMDHINWHVKDHPFASFFQQDQFVRETFERYKSDSMFWCDKAVGGTSIKEVADCVVTCCGDVGIEYWTYGIPTITAAKGFYTDWGISYNAKTLEEYRYYLEHAGDLKKPEAESAALARRYLQKMGHFFYRDDALMYALVKTQKRRERRLMAGELERSDCYYDFTENYLNLLRRDLIKASPLYRLDDMIEVR